jgi:hypothetical protein
LKIEHQEILRQYEDRVGELEHQNAVLSEMYSPVPVPNPIGIDFAPEMKTTKAQKY